MLDKFQKCPYCGKKTMYLVIGCLGEPDGDDVRCYSCKRRWRTNFAAPQREITAKNNDRLETTQRAC